MSPLSLSGHVNRVFVARHGPAYTFPLPPGRGRAFESCQPAHDLLHTMQALSQLELWPPRPSARLGRRGAKTLNTIC